MCIIASVPKGLKLKDEVLNQCWESNSDGAGFMYAENGKLHVQKGFMTLKSFKEALQPHEGKGVVMHFRIRTHGETNEENTHPFVVDKDLAFAHNGVISGFGCKTFSDTWHFNEQIIKDLRQSIPSFLQVGAIQHLLKDAIGYSKLVFMDSQGNVTIVNEDRGEKSEDGVWFSNSSWKAKKVYHHQQSPWKEEPKSNKMKALPFRSSYKEGDYLSLEIENFYGRKYGVAYPQWDKLTKGDIFRVGACNQDNTWDIKNIRTDELFRVKHLINFEKLNLTGNIIHPCGHFIPSTGVLVADIGTHMCLVIDEVLEKPFLVPSTCIRVHIEGTENE